MRLLLWVLLVTLVTLLASADADASKIANADSTMTSKLDSIQARGLLARALSPEVNADGKRSLRVHENDDDATGDDDEGDSYTGEEDEERVLTLTSILGRIEKLPKLSVPVSNPAAVSNPWKKIAKNANKALYKLGITPATVEKMTFKTLGEQNGATHYVKWYNENVANGVIKALD
ncbi:hypothetical protein PRIC1_012456 [Phytophthora ramorum]